MSYYIAAKLSDQRVETRRAETALLALEAGQTFEAANAEAVAISTTDGTTYSVQDFSRALLEGGFPASKVSFTQKQRRSRAPT